MASLGNLAVNLTANTTDLERGAARAKAELSDLRTQSLAVTKTFAKVGAAATAGAAALFAFTQAAANNARELQQMANIANTTTQEFQRMAYGARRFGIEQDKLADILKDTNDRIGDFLSTGAGPMADFFENIAPQVGVTVDQFARLSGPQALQLYVKSLEAANVSQQEMTFYMEALASDATALVPLLRDSGRTMRELADEASELGIILSDFDIARLEDFDRQSKQITATLQGMGNVIAAELSPYLAEIADRFFEAAASGDGFRETVKDSIETSIRVIGFLLDSIEGIRRSFLLAGQGAAAFALGVNAIMAELADVIRDKPISALDEFIDKLDLSATPLGVAVDVFKARGDAIDEATGSAEEFRGAVNAALEDMQATLMEPMPSAGIDEFLNDVEGRVSDFRKNFEETGGLFGTGGGAGRGGTGAGEEDDDEESAGRFRGGIGLFGAEESGAYIERLQAMMEARQDILRDYDSLDAERQQEKFESDMERLKEALELRAITEEEYRKAALEREREFAAEKFNIRQDSESGITGLVDRFNNEQVSSYATAFDSIISSMATYSKTAFQIQKGLAIANAVVKGYEAVVGAYAWGANIGGPPLGAAMAAAAGAATFAQIQSIRSQQFSGGSTSASGGAGASSGGGAGGSAGGGAGGDSRQPTMVDVNLIGGDEITRANARTLVEALNDALADGAQLNIR